MQRGGRGRGRTLAAVGARGRGAFPGRVVEERAAALAVVARRAVQTVAHQAAIRATQAAARVPVALAPRACAHTSERCDQTGA